MKLLINYSVEITFAQHSFRQNYFLDFGQSDKPLGLQYFCRTYFVSKFWRNLVTHGNNF